MKEAKSTKIIAILNEPAIKISYFSNFEAFCTIR